MSRASELAADLADRAPQAGAAFLEATPAVLAHLEPEELEAWAAQGRRLCRGSFKSAKLAARFFRLGPELLESLSLQALERLADAVFQVSQRSDETASLLLDDAPPLLARLAREDREPLLALVQILCGTSWVDAHRCLESAPDLLAAVQPEPRTGVLELAAAAAAEAGREGFSRFAAAAEALGTLDPGQQAEAVEFARRLAPRSARAAIESLASAPAVRRRLEPDPAMRWSEFGLALLAGGRTPERAESYFRLESALAEEMLAELAGRVELARVGATLRLYAQALSGEPLLVQPTRVLVGRNIGWAASTATTTDGLSIFLPPQVDLFGEQRANFQVYKVYTTHQVGRLEFGTFRFRYGADGEHLASTVRERERRTREAEDTSLHAITPMQHFFDLFEDRGLISLLFSLAEDARIDARVRSEYPGTRSWLRRLQELEAARRPDARDMALRQSFVENLVRASLSQADTIRWPVGLAARLERSVAVLRVVERSGATVQDAAEVAAALYDLASAIPNLPPHRIPGDWGGLDERAVGKRCGLTDAVVPMQEELPEGEEVPFESPDAPDYRGALKPELVQLLDELGRREAGAEGGAPLTREQLLELLESSAEIELGEGDDDGAADLEELLANLEREAAERAPDREGDERGGAGEDAAEEIEWFHYDEWDFQVDDYRPAWCRVGERSAAQGELEFYDETLRRYHGLVVETRRQFELMRPEAFRRLKRLEDGHEIDLDQAVEFFADKRAGAGPLARFYTRRIKLNRDVAVAFLLDMSGSTSEPISPAGESDKRIIDIERESTVLVVEALEAIGDAYGIYGFSGYGRENVEFHVIKDLGEPLDDAARRRIDAIEPLRSTRMGPAIRHATAKLLDCEARVKILILVSDGRPQDEEYGPSRYEREYAVRDTKRALLEAKHQRITPFLITVDRTGHDYLGQMCGDMGYEVVADIESLPRRLPKLYRHLAGT
jgi:hypothetical protein